MGSRSACTLLLTVLGATLALPVEAAVLKTSPVFTNNEGTWGYKYFRIPAIVQAPNGHLLAFAEGRRGSACEAWRDWGDIDIVMKRSTDSGRTWGGLTVVANWSTNTVGNPVPIVANGRIVLLTTRNLKNDSQSRIQAGTSEGTRTIHIQTSYDNGYTWVDHDDITSQAKLPGSRWAATGPGHGIQLTAGPQEGRLIATNVFNDGTLGQLRGVQIIYSDDLGATWHRGAQIDHQPGGCKPSESMPVELLLGNSSQSEINVNSRHNGSPLRCMSYSSDGGITASMVPEWSLPSPNVQGSTVRFSSVEQGHGHDRILYAGPTDEQDRRETKVFSSFDETQSFPISKLLHRGPAGYSDLVKMTDGYAGILYVHGTGLVQEPCGSGQVMYAEQISFARFNSHWLDEPTFMQLDFRDRPQSQVVANGSLELDHVGNGINAAIWGNPVTKVAPYDYDHISPTSLRLDGQNDSLEIDDTPNHIFDFGGNESFTIEVVFKTQFHGSGGSNGAGTLIAKNGGFNDPGFWLRVENGRARFYMRDASTSANVTSSAIVNNNAWHHVAVVRDAGSEVRMYTDHAWSGDDAVDLLEGGVANQRDLTIGALGVGINSQGTNILTSFFNGFVAIVRISGGALTPSQFLQPE